MTWTGGAPNSYVTNSGYWTLDLSTSFTCRAPVSAGQFSVPSWILGQLSPGSGFLTVENDTFPQSFTASGLDFGRIEGSFATEKLVTYQ